MHAWKVPCGAYNLGYKLVTESQVICDPSSSFTVPSFAQQPNSVFRLSRLNAHPSVFADASDGKTSAHVYLYSKGEGKKMKRFCDFILTGIREQTNASRYHHAETLHLPLAQKVQHNTVRYGPLERG